MEMVSEYLKLQLEDGTGCWVVKKVNWKVKYGNDPVIQIFEKWRGEIEEQDEIGEVLESNGPQLLWRQGPVSRKTIFPDRGGRGSLGMIWSHYMHCSLHFCYCYVSFTSGYQTLDRRGWGPLF